MASITALRALTSVANPTLYLLGFTTTADGGEGTFNYDSTDTTSADNGGTIIVDASSHRWKRAYKDYVLPEWFGAVGDGSTDDRPKILSALAVATGGIPLIGRRSAVYAVSGQIGLPDGAYLQDMHFKQTETTDSTRCTLKKDTGSGPITLRRVTVDRNGFTYQGSIAHAAGIPLSNLSDVMLEDVEVYGSSMGHGIWLTSLTRLKVIRPYVHDISWSASADPGIEQVVGIGFVNCSDFDLDTPRVSNLLGVIGTDPATPYQTDGIDFGGCTDFRVTGGVVELVGEGIDAGGTSGVAGFSIVGLQAIQCGIYGIKINNFASQGIIADCIADQCGLTGFGLAGNDNIIRDILYIGCKALSTGYGGAWSSSKVCGFEITLDSGTPPANIRFVECEAIDLQATPTMQYGFRMELAPTTAQYRMARMIGCNVYGATIAPTLGYIGEFLCRTIRSSNLSLANNTLTNITWNSTVADPYVMRLASDLTKVVVPENGLYEITCLAEFASNATGYRSLTLMVDGSAVGVRAFTPGNAACAQTVQLTTTITLNAAQVIQIAALQNSGGRSISSPTNACWLSAEFMGCSDLMP